MLGFVFSLFPSFGSGIRAVEAVLPASASSFQPLSSSFSPPLPFPFFLSPLLLSTTVFPQPTLALSGSSLLCLPFFPLLLVYDVLCLQILWHVSTLFALLLFGMPSPFHFLCPFLAGAACIAAP